MENAELLSVARMQAWLETSQAVQFVAEGREAAYAWVERVLVQREYGSQGKKDRGVVRDYLAKMTGKSLPQITRLVRQYRETGQVRTQDYRRCRFVRVYAEADVRLLAQVDRAHQRLSGPATRRILEREVEVYGHQECARLAKISVGHLYNLRKRPDYRKQVAVYEVTRPTQVSIAERRRPDPQGRAGYLRVDTVHQGDWDGHKGVYHINSVDAVTQWEVLGCVPTISAESLTLLLERLLAQYPVPILGFHAENGSEYINHVVAKLLSDALVESTKSRAYQSCDNALVEGKNGAIIRKHIGYGHIAPGHAARIQEFYIRYLNPYLNYHRPCGFATVTVDAKGKRHRRYDAGPNYLVMECLEGHALCGPLVLKIALQYAVRVADALNAAHVKGVVHRDLKPGGTLQYMSTEQLEGKDGPVAAAIAALESYIRQLALELAPGRDHTPCRG